MIRYTFTLDQGEAQVFEVDETRALPSSEKGAPSWTSMQQLRCQHCTLAPDTKHCPAALALIPIVEIFGANISFEMVDLDIELRSYHLHARPQLQDALRSLVGLMLPLSSCPSMSQLRPLARFHEPLADREFTVFRVFSMHLLAQFMRLREGHHPDWELEALRRLYGEIHEVNKRLADRLRSVSSADAGVNSVALLDAVAHAVDYGFEHSLERLRSTFDVYFDGVS